MTEPIIQTANLSHTFQALRSRDPNRVRLQRIEEHPDYKRVPNNNYAPIASAHTGSWGGSMTRMASANTGVIYGQPQFFSPVHSPINWQIPSKRIEQYQWARFFYENEPKVASAIDFYSEFPMSDWDHECKDRKVKTYFDKFKKKHDLNKWTRLISHEVHLLGDCFPLIEIDCPHCRGTGRLGSDICDHEGGTVRRIVILNPDYVEVHSSPMNPEPLISLRPDQDLINMVQRKTPGYEKLHPDVIKLIASGQPIRLDNNNISHLKYGECGYSRFGVGMVRRLFPILSYKTKLMVAQWIVAERLIVPIKIVKVGSDERPAGPADIAAVQAQLGATANDPSMTIITHHAFELDWAGANGKILTLSNEFEFVNQEILDGLMINNALLNGEGPSFGNASVGIEAMIQRLKTFRQQISQWIEKFIYLPEAKRQGFIDRDADSDEEEYIVPTIKWHKMHLRDEQQNRQFVMQLYEKGLLSAQTVLETFEYDPDQEIERKRYDAVQLMALGQGQGQQGGGMGGGGGGGMGGLGGGGGPPMGDMGAPPGGEAPISAPGGAPGGDAGGGAGPIVAKSTSLSSEVADPSQFGGRILKKKNRERLLSEQQKIFKKQQADHKAQQQAALGVNGEQMRDEKGRIVFTRPERELISLLMQHQKDGIIQYAIQPQFRVTSGSSEYPIDFAIPNLKLGLEADGEIFHSSPQQKTKDQERDMKLAQQGWTILRFSDAEIEKKPQQVMSRVVQEIMKKEMMIKQQVANYKSAAREEDIRISAEIHDELEKSNEQLSAEQTGPSAPDVQPEQ